MIYDESFDEDAERAEEARLDALASWLKTQPQDVWLMFVKQMNHDFTTSVVKSVMLDNQDCDFAIVARFFWELDPGYWVESREDWTDGSDLIQLILSNLDKGYYQASELGFSRVEIVMEVQAFALALETRTKKGFAPLSDLPRRLVGPFPGRLPDMSGLPAKELAEVNALLAQLGGGEMHPSNRAWQEAFESNHWIRHYLKLPAIETATDPALRDTSLSDHISAVYASPAAFNKARKRLAADLPYLGRRSRRSLFNKLRWASRNQRGNQQFFEGF
ncbi:DUF4274 domain-containing protein [Hyphomonas jannaschiana]|uniref:DUF4274 domain-containing protein n=1 Tax=Hyphomonas jannaschiana TaxID=86 RepID=UPI0035C6D4E5